MRNLKWLLLFLVIFSNRVKGYNNKQLSECEIDLLSIYKCEDPGYMNCEVAFKSIDGDSGRKAVNITFDLEQTFNEDYTAIVKIDEKQDDGWKEDVYNYDGSLCSLFKNYFPKVWTKAKKESDPQIEAECEIEKGHYEIRNFEETPKDFDVPASKNGEFKITLQVVDPEEEVAVGIIIEVQVNDKGDR